MFTIKGDTVLRCAFFTVLFVFILVQLIDNKKINKSKRTRKKRWQNQFIDGQTVGFINYLPLFFKISIQSNRQLPELRVKQLAKRGTISNSHQIVIQTNNVSLALLIVHIFRLVWPLFSFI